ncbi:hypothetical protein [Streptomyces sp. CAU 1734]|uniref:SCO7613 C-terminal domain-containing membrane protein n=1 Tax=Streptomyces sp. CAU 1734 TaxID=3140360 RepID=UPI0032601C5F
MNNLPPPPPPAEELVILDRELVRLDARRAQLLARRAWLLTVLQPSAGTAPRMRASAASAGSPSAGPTGPAGSRAAGPSAQNVLLALGGLLLAVAAIAFTLVGWGRLGIAGRSAVLGTVTLAALAAPVLLLRRGLTSTAEALGALGLVLLVLDAYALHRVALPGAHGAAYAAWASAVLAVLWAGYGAVVRELRIPGPAAVTAAQLPLVLWAAATAGSGFGPSIEWALLGTAAFDVLVAGAVRRPVVRVFALVGASVAGGLALLAGGLGALIAETPGAAAEPALLLAAGAVLALTAARRAPATALAGGAVAGLALITGAGGLLRTVVPAGWAIPGYLLCAAGLLALTALPAVRRRASRRELSGLSGASAAVHVLALLSVVPMVLMTLAGPVALLGDIWPEHPAQAVPGPETGSLPVPGAAAAPVVLLLVAGVLALLARRDPAGTATAPGVRGTAGPGPEAGPAGAGASDTGSAAAEGAAPDSAPWSSAPGTEAVSGAGTADGSATDHGDAPGGARQATGADTGAGARDTAGAEPRTAPAGHAGGFGRRPEDRAVARGGALLLGWAALFMLPSALSAGHLTALIAQVLLTVAALAAGLRPLPAALPPVALVCGLTGAVSTALLSLVTRPATFTVLGVLFAVLTAVTVRSRASRAARASLACAAVLLGTALLIAGCLAAEAPPHLTALVLIAVPAAVALITARPAAHPVAIPLECAGAAVGLLAALLAAAEPPVLALVLALGGVIASGTALRPERRHVAGAAGALLLVAAAWVRLAAWDVVAPEAYALPVAVPALVVGAVRHRRDPRTSSWQAYGPGLAAALLPSLAAAWGEGPWLRPLLLGLTALAVTLLGARLRLQAPLALGGATLAAVALHELTPHVVQVVDALPRWLPPALAGLLLLMVGATYEQRLREARRLRETVGRMR